MDGWMDRCVGTWCYIWYIGNCARYYLFGFGVVLLGVLARFEQQRIFWSLTGWRVFCVQRVGRKWIAGFSLSSKLSEDEIEENKKKLTKFKESSWKCVYYLSAELLALAVTYNEPWFRNTKYFWVGPGDHLWPNLLAK